MDHLEVAPAYSQLFLTDEGDETFPAEFPDTPVQARDRGLRVSTLMWQDGPTTVDLAVDEPLSVPSGATLAFEGDIATPGHAVVLTDPERRIYWRHPVNAERITVRVWANHPSEPDYLGFELTRIT
jgi:hypothetical protein